MHKVHFFLRVNLKSGVGDRWAYGVSLPSWLDSPSLSMCVLWTSGHVAAWLVVGHPSPSSIFLYVAFAWKHGGIGRAPSLLCWFLENVSQAAGTVLRVGWSSTYYYNLAIIFPDAAKLVWSPSRTGNTWTSTSIMCGRFLYDIMLRVRTIRPALCTDERGEKMQRPDQQQQSS